MARKIRVDELLTVTEAKFSKVMRRIAFDLYGRLLLNNPVDTGRCRAAWNMTLNKANLAVPPELPPGQSYPPPALPVLPDVTPNDIIIVSNNISYIVPLEHGHSKRAPNGFIRLSMLETATAAAAIAAVVSNE